MRRTFVKHSTDATVPVLERGHVWQRSIGQFGMLTTTETSALLRLTARHIYRLVGTEFHPLRRGGRLLFPISELRRALEKRKRPLPAAGKEVMANGSHESGA